MSALGILVNVAKLVSTGIQIADMLGGKEPSKKSTLVHMVTGAGDDSMVSLVSKESFSKILTSS